MNNIIENNCLTAVLKLIEILKIPLTRTTIKNELVIHPNYPSLLSVSDKLTEWNIENVALKIDKSKISKMQFPLVAQVNQLLTNENEKRKGIIDQRAESLFVVVDSISQDKVTFSDVERGMKWKTIPIEEFEKIWTGVVLIVAPLKNAGEENYRMSFKKEIMNKIIIYLGALIVLTVFAIAYYRLMQLSSIIGDYPLIYYILEIIGTAICILLLKYELDKDSSIVKKACSIGRQKNCNTILESKASKIAGLSSWSEIGFGYFMGGLLLLIFSNINASHLVFLALLSLPSIIYVFFSLYYQKFIAKEWCNLCLSIQVIILLQFTFSVIYLRTFQVIPIYFDKFILLYLIYLLFPVVAWLILKPFLISKKNWHKEKVLLSRLKSNTEIFEALLMTQKEVSKYEGLGITLGNINGKYKILKVCNPYCGPCARAHPFVENIIEFNKEVQVQMIFNATSNINDNKAKPVRHFLEYSTLATSTKITEVLNEWYNAPEKDYDLFAAKHPLRYDTSDYDIKLDAMSKWCNDNGIVATPTYFVNGRQLPEMYSIEDLKYLLL